MIIRKCKYKTVESMAATPSSDKDIKSKKEEKKMHNNNIIKQTERLKSKYMTRLRNKDGWHTVVDIG